MAKPQMKKVSTATPGGGKLRQKLSVVKEDQRELPASTTSIAVQLRPRGTAQGSAAR